LGHVGIVGGLDGVELPLLLQIDLLLRHLKLLLVLRIVSEANAEAFLCEHAIVLRGIHVLLRILEDGGELDVCCIPRFLLGLSVLQVGVSISFGGYLVLLSELYFEILLIYLVVHFCKIKRKN